MNYDEHVTAEIAAFVAAQGCRCRQIGETVYPCEAHVVEEFERQYGADASTYRDRILTLWKS